MRKRPLDEGELFNAWGIEQRNAYRAANGGEANILELCYLSDFLRAAHTDLTKEMKLTDPRVVDWLTAHRAEFDLQDSQTDGLAAQRDKLGAQLVAAFAAARAGFDDNIPKPQLVSEDAPVPSERQPKKPVPKPIHASRALLDFVHAWHTQVEQAFKRRAGENAWNGTISTAMMISCTRVGQALAGSKKGPVAFAGKGTFVGVMLGTDPYFKDLMAGFRALEDPIGEARPAVAPAAVAG